MRTRTRTLSATVPAGKMEQFQSNPTAYATTTTAAIAYTSLSETITDEEHVNRRRSGTVVHSKERTVICDAGVTTTLWSYPPQTYRSVYTGGWLYRTLVEPKLGSLPPRPTVTQVPMDWRQASYDALKQMRPSVDEGLLLPNFAAELVESVSLLKQYAARRVKRAERQRRNAEADQRRRDREEAFLERQGYRSNRKGPIEAIVSSLPSLSKLLGLAPRVVERIGKTIAWVNLVYQFAIRPTIQDARALASVIENWRKRVAELIRQAEKRQIRHYKRPVDNLFSLPQTAQWGNFTFDRETTNVVRISEWVTRPVYHANMLFTYDASRLKGLFGQLDGLIHALGVNRIASVVWEAIPFSFVVDWFVNVGDVIASIEDNLEGDSLLPVVIHDFSHSLKWEYRTRMELRWKPQGSGYNIQVDTAHYYTSYYERRRDYPSLWDSLSVRLPNLNQAGLGLSLIVVKMDGVHR